MNCWVVSANPTYAATAYPLEAGGAAPKYRLLAYDPAGRITGYFHTATPALNQGFGYDQLDRLTRFYRAFALNSPHKFLMSPTISGSLQTPAPDMWSSKKRQPAPKGLGAFPVDSNR